MTELQKLQYGDTLIEYELDYEERARLAIHVYPDLSIKVDAPFGASFEDIEKRIYKRASWILKQQRTFEKYLFELPKRKYISGETHRYLGRQYRLKIIKGEPSVKLLRGRIVISTPDTNDTQKKQEQLKSWYRNQACRVFDERMKHCFLKIKYLNIPYPTMQVRIMRSRWGSCTSAGKILLNPKLVEYPKYQIDYVINHELCHLKEHGHTKAFYRLLTRVMPDWKKIKEELNTPKS